MREETRQPRYKIGIVDSIDDRLKIKFAGEDEASAKEYTYLSSYSPQINDRVLISRVKGSYVVLGKIEGAD